MELKNSFHFNFDGNTNDSCEFSDWIATNVTFNTIDPKVGSGSAVFDGTANIVSSRTIVLNTGAFTIEGWFRTTTTINSYNPQRILVSYGAADSQAFNVLFIGSVTNGSYQKPNTLNLFVTHTGSGISCVDPMNDGNWHHFAFSQDGKKIYSFLDGVLKEEQSGNINFAGPFQPCIGGKVSNYDSRFVGELDDFMVTCFECKYTSSFTPPTSGLVPEKRFLFPSVQKRPYVHDIGIPYDKINKHIMNKPIHKRFMSPDIDIPSGQKTHKIEGTIKDFQNNPISRKVCVFSKKTDRLLGSAMSNAVTGKYSIEVSGADSVYVVCFPENDEDINAKIFDRVVPVEI